MKKACLFFLLIFVISVAASHAQLINQQITGKITKVDKTYNRLEVLQKGAAEGSINYVLVDGRTKVYGADGKRMSWENLSQGQIVQCKGGMTFDMKLRAKAIHVKKEW
ncbi:MAG: hypothetical protein HYU64_09190 [Armatimonadetes bacterium]|nr:hypothetical protein [Armatimonadota bacterium]